MQDFRTDRAALSQPDSQAAMADRGAALWRAIDRDLSPVIGRRATLALHRRALFLTRASLAWLPEPMEHDTLEDCRAQLCGVLATRSVEEAEAAARALELTCQDLLVSLIGTGLTTQLLRSAGAPRPNDGLGQGDAP